MKKLLVLVVGAGLLAGSAPGWAQEAKKRDERVAKVFDAAGIKYVTNETGDFQLLSPAEGDRTQALFITSGTNTFGALEIREVWAIGYSSKEPPPADLLARLLADNATTVVGAWRLEKAGDATHLIFAVQIPAEVDWPTLGTALKTVAVTADATEKRLTGKDDY
ncbi:MAG TPA: hypothetical protein VJS92_03890 [Candidatus Polarisedimenticolaceae bacterium]|nr:hypothetical protein [Candidatus Polarisedimenticolaceae bacterium]